MARSAKRRALQDRVCDLRREVAALSRRRDILERVCSELEARLRSLTTAGQLAGAPVDPAGTVSSVMVRQVFAEKFPELKNWDAFLEGLRRGH